MEYRPSIEHSAWGRVVCTVCRGRDKVKPTHGLVYIEAERNGTVVYEVHVVG